MSQVFGADSVNNTTATAIATSGETVLCTGNFVNPPFGNAKAIVQAMVSFTAPASSTSIQLRLRRNPNGENLSLAGAVNMTVTALNAYTLSISAADAIPDGRPVQYALTIQPTGASASNNAFFANVSTLLISG